MNSFKNHSSQHSVYTYLLSIMLLTLSACQFNEQGASSLSEQSSADQELMRRAAIVTTGYPKLDPALPSVISWNGAVPVTGNMQNAPIAKLQGQVRRSLNRQILRKGYPLQAGQGNIQLQVAVILASQQEKAAIMFGSGGVDPGLTSVATDADIKGTLALTLKQGRLVRWRGTVQIYLPLQSDNHLLQQRIDYAIRQLLYTWP